VSFTPITVEWNFNDDIIYELTAYGFSTPHFFNVS
jgi:hypothetical protein